MIRTLAAHLCLRANLEALNSKIPSRGPPASSSGGPGRTETPPGHRSSTRARRSSRQLRTAGAAEPVGCRGGLEPRCVLGLVAESGGTEPSEAGVAARDSRLGTGSHSPWCRCRSQYRYRRGRCYPERPYGSSGVSRLPRCPIPGIPGVTPVAAGSTGLRGTVGKRDWRPPDPLESLEWGDRTGPVYFFIRFYLRRGGGSLRVSPLRSGGTGAASSSTARSTGAGGQRPTEGALCLPIGVTDRKRRKLRLCRVVNFKSPLSPLALRPISSRSPPRRRLGRPLSAPGAGGCAGKGRIGGIRTPHSCPGPPPAASSATPSLRPPLPLRLPLKILIPSPSPAIDFPGRSAASAGTGASFARLSTGTGAPWKGSG